ncbi:glycerol-3-phosphate 1-O-acyltransferase PlsY [Ectothiorhodospiraceae bacterium 2226]|nr:glycerol-3-phosphate 1-O-acyltransferase PlsY [Ectothiorhodospiraceae bacterium 2226]
MPLLDIALILFAYLLGSVSTAIVLCRLMGLPDPRSQGSGNPGATNILRTAGKRAGAFTLLGDAIKGLIPILVAQALGMTPLTLILVALAAFLGHLYPVYFGFRGGKGVATALGVALGLYWPLGVALVLTWLLVAVVFRYSSLAALVAAALAPAYAWILTGLTEYTLGVGVMAALLIWRHRSNIRNLLAGTESPLKRRER